MLGSAACRALDVQKAQAPVHESLRLTREGRDQAGSSHAAPSKLRADDPGTTVNVRATTRSVGCQRFGVGDMVNQCRLIAELGCGRSGQVFLAQELALGNRPIVLKIAAADGDEHLKLAKLQHPNIMPLLWARTLDPEEFRVMAMPYRARTTLAGLFCRLETSARETWTGQRVFEELQKDQTGLPDEIPVTEPLAQILAQSTWVEFVLRLGRALAEALAYLHQRELIHLDIKPANVVLTPDGQPLLIDVDIARPPLSAGDTLVRCLGGTPAFMSPEQSAAMHALMRELSMPQAVDARSDLYALGLVMYDALGGLWNDHQPPDPLNLSRADPNVSPTLVQILGFCLAQDPADRYPNCKVLADELARCLKELPMQESRASWQGAFMPATFG